jgi:hypothetical protein
MLNMHEPQRHLAMIRSTAEFFTHLGNQFESQPLGLENDVDRSFQPNLVLKKVGERIYMEVEISHMKKKNLDQDMENTPAAGGCICMVLDIVSTLLQNQKDIVN